MMRSAPSLAPVGASARPWVPSSRLASAMVVFAFASTMLGTTLPTPLYPSYEERFGFRSLTVTIVFAMYAVGVLVALVGFGRASDTLGRRPVLLVGLAFAGLSSGVFLVVAAVHADGVPLLLAGRFLSGVSAGIFTGTATAALSDFAKPHAQLRASLLAAIANIGGLGLGPLVAGVLAHWVALPLTTSFLVHLALVVVAAATVVILPEPVAVLRPRRLRFQRLKAPTAVRPILIRAGTAGFAGFAVLGLFTAVSPAVLALLGHPDPALTGLVVFTVFAASAAGQLTSARLPSPVSLLVGTGCLVIGMGTVAASLWRSSLVLLLIGGVIAGASQGLAFRAALGTVTEASPTEHRGAVASTFFAICYVGISLPIVGVGAGTERYGLVRTGEVFAGVVALLSLGALVSLVLSNDSSADGGISNV